LGGWMQLKFLLYTYKNVTMKFTTLYNLYTLIKSNDETNSENHIRGENQNANLLAFAKNVYSNLYR
jgi:hypothetical protein